MSRLILKPHHLQNLPASVAADIAWIFGNPCIQEHVSNEAIANLLVGQTRAEALKNARCDTWRGALRPSGWVSFENQTEEELPLCERIAAPEQEEIEHWRTAQLDAATESLLATLAAGTAALGYISRITPIPVEVNQISWLFWRSI